MTTDDDRPTTDDRDPVPHLELEDPLPPEHEGVDVEGVSDDDMITEHDR
jgi:hypothetical protein